MTRQRLTQSRISPTAATRRRRPRPRGCRLSISLLLCACLIFSGCFLTSDVETYYGRVETPRTQELRWSDGGLPQTFDPALAAAPPDTDAVRALFEGLTEYDPQTLTPVPGVATRWESSEDKREWTFFLRNDARWSNGDSVTAQDFVRSWQRTLSLGTRAPHSRLLVNIAGVAPPAASVLDRQGHDNTAVSSQVGSDKNEVSRETRVEAKIPRPEAKFGAVADGDYVLRVRLDSPDDNFPALVAHPIFRPVHRVREEDGSTAMAEPIVSNGAFKLSQVAKDGVILERAGNYWDAQTVNLNRVRFVATNNAEEALKAYREGDVDAVTNAGFEPLALKLLAPYKDFRRATFGALTYYKFNLARAPFDDVRVREALAVAIDRERISEDGMDGASEPAKTFLPAQSSAAGKSGAASQSSLDLDVARAQKLLADAGYAQGAGFPRVRLLVNRNDRQRLIALSVAAMWRKFLGIETDVIVKNWDEYETALRDGDYDVVRQGMVMQTMDETANMRAMFDPLMQTKPVGDPVQSPGSPNATPTSGVKENGADQTASEKKANAALLRQPILSETEALKELPAIPIYFASSYTLVKPYLLGFESNLLDAPSLKRVRIDTSWKMPTPNNAVWAKVGK